MNKPSKCKNCQWYGKPYWSIINPCDNCPYEEINTTITIDNKKIINDFVNDKNFTIIFDYVSKPYEETIIEQDKEIARLNKIIDELEKNIKENIDTLNTGNEAYYEKTYRLALENNLEYLKELKEEGNNDGCNCTL